VYVGIRFVRRVRELITLLIPGLDLLFLYYDRSDDWRVVLATLPYPVVVLPGRYNGRSLLQWLVVSVKQQCAFPAACTVFVTPDYL